MCKNLFLPPSQTLFEAKRQISEIASQALLEGELLSLGGLLSVSGTPKKDFRFYPNFLPLWTSMKVSFP